MSEFEIPVGSLEEQALKRKERLRNLKRKAETKPSESTQSNGNENARKLSLPRPVEILNTATDDGEITEIENEETKPPTDDVVSKITSELNDLRTPLVIDEIDIQNLAPRKPDWDLKRDVAKKLEILERRTQRAIAEIIRDRLRANQTEVDLQAVNTVGYSAQSSETK